MMLFKCWQYHISPFGLLCNTTRRFSFSCLLENNKYLNREARFLNKFVACGSSKRKRPFYIGDVPTSNGGLTLGKKFQPSKENNRRINVLNSLFMKHISDLLAAGNIADDVLGKGLEISRIAVAPNFNQLNVFWSCTSDENAVSLEAVLPQLGFRLRHELTQLQVMGVVPSIIFIKDKHLNRVQKVEHLLSIADYGEDFFHSLPLHSDFKDSQSSQNESIEAESGTKEASSEELMPVMRQDVFNLDHDKIMKKILKSKKKARALHRFQPEISVDGKGMEDNLAAGINNMTKQERKEAIDKFILARRLLKEKSNKNKYNSELNVLDLDFKQNDIEYYETDDFESDDYIEEDKFEDKKYQN